MLDKILSFSLSLSRAREIRETFHESSERQTVLNLCILAVHRVFFFGSFVHFYKRASNKLAPYRYLDHLSFIE